MFTVQQYRSKARVYEMLLKTACSVAEAVQYRDLQQSYTSLADNLDWLAANAGKTVAGQPNVEGGKRAAERAEQLEAGYAEQENILRALGGAVILNWNTIPTQLQRALFEAASTIQDERAAPLKEVLAQFLHDHKNDARRARERGDRV
jgi:uncharacterized coiled-coil protein SlyX